MCVGVVFGINITKHPKEKHNTRLCKQKLTNCIQKDRCTLQNGRNSSWFKHVAKSRIKLREWCWNCGRDHCNNVKHFVLCTHRYGGISLNMQCDNLSITNLIDWRGGQVCYEMWLVWKKRWLSVIRGHRRVTITDSDEMDLLTRFNQSSGIQRQETSNGTFCWRRKPTAATWQDLRSRVS